MESESREGTGEGRGDARWLIYASAPASARAMLVVYRWYGRGRAR